MDRRLVAAALAALLLALLLHSDALPLPTLVPWSQANAKGQFWNSNNGGNEWRPILVDPYPHADEVSRGNVPATCMLSPLTGIGGGAPGLRPPRPVVSERPTLFIGISSYEDGPRCANTIIEAFKYSVDPDSITLGVVQQHNPGSPDCLETYCERAKKEHGTNECPRINQIRILRVPAKDAKGPTWARALQEAQLMGDEEFCLQVDSHSAFIDDFDRELRNEWLAADNENAILTTYVKDFSQRPEARRTPHGQSQVPHLCDGRFLGNGLLRNERASNVMGITRPFIGLLWAAGFSYGKCRADREVPYDIHTPFVFDGEEFFRGARMWTAGYDFYSPSKDLVFHNYTQNVRHKQWDWNKNNKDAEIIRGQSAKRLLHIFGVPQTGEFPREELVKFGLGTKRSVLDYFEYTGGVDLANRKLGNRDCLGKPWVPYPHAELSTSRLNAIVDKHNLPKYPPESLEKQIERINELKRAEKGEPPAPVNAAPALDDHGISRREKSLLVREEHLLSQEKDLLARSQELSGAHHQLEMKQAEAFAKLRSQQDRLVEQQSDLREREKALHARETVSWVFLGLCIGAALLLVPRMLGRGSMRSITKQRTV